MLKLLSQNLWNMIVIGIYSVLFEVFQWSHQQQAKFVFEPVTDTDFFFSTAIHNDGT